MSVNENLNRYVKEKGIKQIYIAQETGLTKDVVSKILRGKRKMSADEFLSICFALNVEPRTFQSVKRDS